MHPTTRFSLIAVVATALACSITMPQGASAFDWRPQKYEPFK